MHTDWLAEFKIAHAGSGCPSQPFPMRDEHPCWRSSGIAVSGGGIPRLGRRRRGRCSGLGKGKRLVNQAMSRPDRRTASCKAVRRACSAARAAAAGAGELGAAIRTGSAGGQAGHYLLP